MPSEDEELAKDQLSFGRWAKSSDDAGSSKAPPSAASLTGADAAKPTVTEEPKTVTSSGSAELRSTLSDLRPPSAFASHSQTGFEKQASGTLPFMHACPLACIGHI